MDGKVKITFLGDIMFPLRYQKIYKTTEEIEEIFRYIKPRLEQSDTVIANLETPISYDNSNLTNHKWEFNAPLYFAEALRNVGIDFVSTANNHCLDRGVAGIDSTVMSLDYLGIKHTGVFSKQGKRSSFVNVQGIKAVVASFTYGTNAVQNKQYLSTKDKWRVNMLQGQEMSSGLLRYLFLSNSSWKLLSLIKRIAQKIYFFIHPENRGKEWFEWEYNNKVEKELFAETICSMKKSDAEIKIMLIHAGGQYNDEPNRFTHRIADYCQDSKIDITVINHEHVVHPVRINNQQVVAYCLGNLLSDTGIYDAPLDKKAEYSIGLHAYLGKDRGNLVYSFSIYRQVRDVGNDSVVIVPVDILFDRLKSEKEKNDLLGDVRALYEKVTGKIADNIFIQAEYFL